MTSSRFPSPLQMMIALVLCLSFAPLVSAQCPTDSDQARPTALETTVQKGDAQNLTPQCMTGIKKGSWVAISPSGQRGKFTETVEVTSVTDHTFTAKLEYDHKAGDWIEVVDFIPCLPRNANGEPASKPYESDQGVITVGCPKVWRSERVFTVLDGILRDVDSITLKALQDLDPNSANLAQIVTIVNDLQANAQFNQAAGINNALKLQEIKVNRAADLKNAESLQKSNQLLMKKREVLAQQSLELQKQELAAVKKGGADPSKNTQLKAIQDQEQAVEKQLADINTELAKPAIAEQSVSKDQFPDLKPPTTGTALLNSLPDSLTKAFQNALQQPTLPASVQMDNVIELLHQRLAREFSVMYDDLVRQKEYYDVYLLQFDIGILPRHGAKDREAQISFSFSDPAILAYELYPGMSNYNIMRGMDKTNRIGISGMAQSIIGFGLAASFNHERHELRSGLSQSLFVSGFGAGTNRFGWLIGPAPYENFLNPGNRIVHTLILVPKGHGRSGVTMNVSYCWPQREQRYHWPWTGHSQSCSEESQETSIAFTLPKQPGLRVNQVVYVPADDREIPGAVAAESPENSYLLLSFKDPIDANLVITANSKIINRVRDVRGRGIFGGNQEKVTGGQLEQDAVSGSRFGFLEKDKVDPDTWLQTSSNSLVMDISRTTAGTDTFPVITLSAPGAQAGELTTLLQPDADIRIGEWNFKGNNEALSAFQPLFTQRYSPGRIKVYVDQVDGQYLPTRLHIISEPIRGHHVWLHEAAQVVLAVKGQHEINGKRQPRSDEGWALRCDEEEGTLSCDVPVKKILERYTYFPPDLKVWIDEPPYFGRPGLWADSDISATPVSGDHQQLASAAFGPASGLGYGNGTVVGPAISNTRPWKPDAYAVGNWSDVQETSCLECREPNHWEATIKLRNLDSLKSVLPPPKGSQARLIRHNKNIQETSNPQPDPYCIQGLEEINKQLAHRASTFKPAKIGPDFYGMKADAESQNQAKAQEKRAHNELNDESNQEISARFDANDNSITISVPFVALPAVAGRFRLQRESCEARAAANNSVILPELASKLLPGPVVVTNLGNGYYRLTGERMRAVDQVRLEGSSQIIISDAAASLNSVDFLAKVNGEELPKGSYAVFAVIGTMTVPLQVEDGNKNLEPATITIADPKDAEKKDTNQATDEKTKVGFKLKLDVKTDASEGKGSASGGKKAKTPAASTAGQK